MVLAVVLCGIGLEPEPVTAGHGGGIGSAVITLTTTPLETEAGTLRSKLDRPLSRFGETRPLKHRWPPLMAMLSAVALVAVMAGRLNGHRPVATTAAQGRWLLATPRGPPSPPLAL